MQGLREAFQGDVQVHSVASAGDLQFYMMDGWLPANSILLLVFPDNHPVDCLCSLIFLNEWSRMGYPEVPCLLWGRTTLIRGTENRLPVIPWRLSPVHLRYMVNHEVRGWRARMKSWGIVRYRMRLSPREIVILRHSLEGASLEQIAVMLGINSKTVWAHRRHAMNMLGIRRLSDLMRMPQGVFHE